MVEKYSKLPVRAPLAVKSILDLSNKYTGNVFVSVNGINLVHGNVKEISFF